MSQACLMSLPKISGKYRPSKYIKVNERLFIPSKLKQGNNVIVTRNEETLDLKSLIFLGKILEHTSAPDHFASNVWLDMHYPYVILIPGRRGTGKSYTLGILAEGLSYTHNNSNVTTKETSHTCLIIDTLGQFWQMKYQPTGRDAEEKRQLELLNLWGLSADDIQNIQTYVPSGVRTYEDWKELKLRFLEIQLEEIAGALNLDIYADRMGQLLNHVFHSVKEEGYDKFEIDERNGTLRFLSKISPNENYEIQDFIDCIDSDHKIISPQTGYQIQTRRALRSRLVEMKRWKLFSGVGTSISEIFKKGYLTIINLEAVGENFRNLIVGVLVRKIFQAREKTRSKEKISEIRGSLKYSSDDIFPGWLFLDEAHEYCPSSGTTASKKILIRYAKEGRSLGLGLIMATQQPSALAPMISSQSELLISHALAFMSDIKALNDRLVNKIVTEYHGRSEVYSFEDQVRSLSPGTSLVSAMGVSRIFLVDIRPRLTIHGGKVPKME